MSSDNGALRKWWPRLMSKGALTLGITVAGYFVAVGSASGPAAVAVGCTAPPEILEMRLDHFVVDRDGNAVTAWFIGAIDPHGGSAQWSIASQNGSGGGTFLEGTHVVPVEAGGGGSGRVPGRTYVYTLSVETSCGVVRREFPVVWPRPNLTYPHILGTRVGADLKGEGFGNQVSVAAKRSTKLLKPEQLLGYHIAVSPARRQKLQDATVKIVRRFKDTKEDWQLWCSGAMVSMTASPDAQTGGPPQKLALSAGHCWDEEAGRKKDSTGAAVQQAPATEFARDYVNGSAYEYGVVDALTPYLEGEKLQPFAIARGISVNARNEDFAILLLEPRQSPDGAPQAGRALDDFPTFVVPKKTSRPIPGQEIALFGWPSSSNRPVIGTGRFLGRINNWNSLGIRKMVDIIGIRTPDGLSGDSCFRGASGSVAVGRDYLSGTLTHRVNSVDDPAHFTQFVDHIAPGAPGYAERVEWWRKALEGWRTEIQIQLKVSVKRYDTLCIFEVPRIDQKRHTFQELYDGLGDYPPR